MNAARISSLFPRKSKYRAKPQVVDGERFDSKGELKRWRELQLLEKAGEISGLRRQVPIQLRAEGGGLVGVLVIDFTYYNPRDEMVFEDFKGFITPLARWKIKHVEAQYDLTVRITR